LSVSTGYPIVNDPLYNHPVFGPEKGKGGNIGKSDEQLIQDLISIHNAENWLGIEGEDSVGGGGGDIFGLPPPASSSSSVSSDAHHHLSAPSPSSSSSGTLDGGSSSDLLKGECENSPLSDDVKNNGHPDEFSQGKSENEVAISVSSSAGGSGFVEVGTQEGGGDGGDTPGKVTVGTQTGDDEEVSFLAASVPREQQSPVVSNMVTSGSQTSSCQLSLQQQQQQQQSPSTSNCSALSPQSNHHNENNNQLDDQLRFQKGMMTYDPHCYECKVRYRDPKPKDLVMYLHAIRYGVSLLITIISVCFLGQVNYITKSEVVQ